ncbi:TPA: hypothetical protein N0F65_002199, partial [Lagenidium giganteum]
ATAVSGRGAGHCHGHRRTHTHRRTMNWKQVQAFVADFLRKCEETGIQLPEVLCADDSLRFLVVLTCDPLQSVIAAAEILKQECKHEMGRVQMETALQKMRAKFGHSAKPAADVTESRASTTPKRKRSASSADASRSSSGDVMSISPRQRHSSRKRAKAQDDVLARPAKRPENQELVKNFVELGQYELNTGHSQRGVARLRAAKELRDAPMVITSGAQAKLINRVGNSTAAKVDELLQGGLDKALSEYKNESTVEDALDEMKQLFPIVPPPVKKKQTKTPPRKAQKKPPSKSPTPRMMLSPPSTSQQQQQSNKRVAQQQQSPATPGKPPLASKVKARAASIKATHPAKVAANQPLADKLIDVGTNDLHQGRIQQGISRLKAAKEIRNVDTPITSASEARQVPGVGPSSASKVAQVLKQRKETTVGDAAEESENESEDEEEEMVKDEDDKPDAGKDEGASDDVEEDDSDGEDVKTPAAHANSRIIIRDNDDDDEEEDEEHEEEDAEEEQENEGDGEGDEGDEGEHNRDSNDDEEEVDDPANGDDEAFVDEMEESEFDIHEL